MIDGRGLTHWNVLLKAFLTDGEFRVGVLSLWEGAGPIEPWEDNNVLIGNPCSWRNGFTHTHVRAHTQTKLASCVVCLNRDGCRSIDKLETVI